MSFPLPPIPQNPVSNTFEWREWLYKVSSALKEQVTPTFMGLDFTGSNMTAIKTRNHNDLQGLQGGSGGEYYHLTKAEHDAAVTKNYGSWQNTASQTFAAANTPTLIAFNTTDYSSNITYNTGDGFHVTNAGLYNLQFSFQLANSSTSSINEFWVWLRKNGTDLSGTTSKVSVASSHGGVDGYTICSANFFVNLAAGDWVELWAAVNSTSLFIEAYPALTTPFAAPSDPGVVVTMTQVA